MSETIPATLTFEPDARGIAGISRAPWYKLWPTLVEMGVALPGPGQKRVITAKLAAFLGKPITAEDLAAARERIREDRERFLTRKAEYRAKYRAQSKKR